MNSNRNYKDGMFKDLFSDKENLLELYYAIQNENLTSKNTKLKAEDIKINTLEDVLYINIKNDLSFVFDDYLSLYEQQSTICSNMCLRGLLYISKLYDGMTQTRQKYSTRKLMLPTPEYIVFYNGNTKLPKEQILKLSDSYIHKTENVCLEFKARIININYEENAEVLTRCKVLKGYSYFIKLVREYRKEFPLEEAIRLAINDCKDADVLKEYLEKRGDEVMSFLTSGYDYELDIKVKQEEAREDGIQKGICIGEERGILIGKIEAMIKIISKYTNGNIPDSVLQKIKKQNDINILDRWFEIALDVSSIEEFEKRITE